MKFVRTRKPRGLKKDGTESYDFCTGCYSPFCDPTALSPYVSNKIQERLRSGCCPACGKPWVHCSCHSTLEGKSTRMVTHNNKKEKRFVARKNELSEQMRQVVFRLEQLDSLSDDGLLPFLQIQGDLARFRPDKPHDDMINMIKRQMGRKDVLWQNEIHLLGEILSFYLYNGGVRKPRH